MTPLILAVLLSVVSAVSYAGAALLQERLAVTTSPRRLRLLRSATWWLAAVLQGAGALLHVVALGYGPLTVVQPLGVLTLVLAAPLGAAVARRRVTGAAWRGIALVSAGLAGILLLTGAQGRTALTGGQQAVLAVAVLGAVVLLVAGSAPLVRTGRGGGGAGRARALRSVALALAAGVAYGAASVLVKTFAQTWTDSPLTRTVPLLALIALFAGAGLAASQASYRGGGLAAPLATATVANPVVAAVAGILLLDEGFRYGLLGALLAALAAAVTAWGLVVLTYDASARRARDGERPPPGPRPEDSVPFRARVGAADGRLALPEPGPAVRHRRDGDPHLPLAARVPSPAGACPEPAAGR
ncbi:MULTISPECIES: DMT family transporter, partial [Streptomyces]|uniref:Integral membrane protein n=1 Tax=Streptomyces cacaoi TaxID=1898 RepID=A0A4Y3QU89_STRCI